MRKPKTTPSSSAGYEPGGNWVVCDICGKQIRAYEAKIQPHGIWKGLVVCSQDADEYNPQLEDLKGVPENMAPKKTNMEPEPITITYATRITADDL